MKDSNIDLARMSVLLNAAVDGGISHTKCWLFQPNWLFYQSNWLQRGYCGSQTSRDLLDFNNRGACLIINLLQWLSFICVCSWLCCPVFWQPVAGCSGVCRVALQISPTCCLVTPDGHASVTSCSLSLQLPQFISHSCPPRPADTPHICLSLLSFGSRITRNICTC